MLTAEIKESFHLAKDVINYQFFESIAIQKNQNYA